LPLKSCNCVAINKFSAPLELDSFMRRF
jgi:hypothetical protein